MSFNKLTLSSLISGHVTTLTSELCIVGFQKGAPRPKAPTPYSVVNLFNSAGIGWDYSDYSNQEAPDVDLIETIKGNRMLSFSFNFYRTNAFDTAEKFRTLLHSESSLEFFNSAGLGLSTRSPIRFLDAEIAADWEERAQIDVDFNLINAETLVIRTIQSAEITAEYQAGGFVETETITISE